MKHLTNAKLADAIDAIEDYQDRIGRKIVAVAGRVGFSIFVDRLQNERHPLVLRWEMAAARGYPLRMEGHKRLAMAGRRCGVDDRLVDMLRELHDDQQRNARDFWDGTLFRSL